MSKAQTLTEAFREELLRWNQQINLVSRQETSDRLDGLFRQCIGGVGAVAQVIERLNTSFGPGYLSHYFDLGSGGGLPGVLWHIIFSDNLPGNPGVGSPKQALITHLVEPREKRAWFLNRLNRIPEIPVFEVLHGRWGDVCINPGVVSIEKQARAIILISLKALHLDDEKVLAGLSSAMALSSLPYRVIITRYYPPEQILDNELVSSLGIPSSGFEVQVDGVQYCSLGGEVVPLAQPGEGLASIVVSSYDVIESS